MAHWQNSFLHEAEWSGLTFEIRSAEEKTVELMKTKKFRIVTGLVLSLVVITSLTIAAAMTLNHQHIAKASSWGTPCNQPPGQQATCHFSGFWAQADYSTVDYSTCADGVFTQISVFVSDNTDHYPPGSPEARQFSGVYITTYNNCTFTYQGFAGHSSSMTLKTTGALGTAALQATVPSDDTSQNQVFTVNLTWNGYGSIDSQMDSQHIRTGDTLLITHFTGDNRQALFNGTVSDGTTTYTLAGTSTMNSAKSGDIETVSSHP